MILLTGLRFIRSIWTEARELQREAMKRYPILGQH